MSLNFFQGGNQIDEVEKYNYSSAYGVKSTKLSDCIESINLKWAVMEYDEDTKEYKSIRLIDWNGKLYGSNSKTVMKSFEELCACFGDNLFKNCERPLEVCKDVSKGGRTFCFLRLKSSI